MMMDRPDVRAAQLWPKGGSGCRESTHVPAPRALELGSLSIWRFNPAVQCSGLQGTNSAACTLSAPGREPPPARAASISSNCD